MPKVSIYVPNDLHRRALELKLPVGKICQAAIADAVAENSDSLSELLDRQMHNIERIIEVYKSLSVSGYQALIRAGVDPLKVFEGLPIAQEHVAAAETIARGQRAAHG